MSDADRIAALEARIAQLEARLAAIELRAPLGQIQPAKAWYGPSNTIGPGGNRLVGDT